MHYLLEKLFKKNGVQEIADLSADEASTYDRWQKTLSEGDITVDRIRDFCIGQVSIIENKWKNLDNDSKKNDRLIVMHNVYKTILDAIDKPRAERESLEKYLQQLVEM